MTSKGRVYSYLLMAQRGKEILGLCDSYTQVLYLSPGPLGPPRRPLMLKSVASQGLLCTLLAWLGPSELSSPWSPLRNQGSLRSAYAFHPGQSPWVHQQGLLMALRTLAQ